MGQQADVCFCMFPLFAVCGAHVSNVTLPPLSVRGAAGVSHHAFGPFTVFGELRAELIVCVFAL